MSRIMTVLGVVAIMLIATSPIHAQSVQMRIPDTSAMPGENVTIPVNIGNTTGLGIIAVEMTIQYNSQILSITQDPSLSGTIASAWNILSDWSTPGEISISMIWNAPNLEQLVPLSGSGALVKLNFKVQPSAQLGSTSPLQFIRAILNEGTPTAVTQNGTFTVGESSGGDKIPGDINGDDSVDSSDVLELILAYNKTSGETGFNSSADLNGDGVINSQDMVIIWQNFGAQK